MSVEQRGPRSAMSIFLAMPADHPRVVLSTTAIIVALSVLAITRLKPSASLEMMMAANDPAAVALGRLLSDFGPLDDLLIVANDREESRSKAQVQARLTRFAECLQTRVDSDLDLRHNIAHMRWRHQVHSPEQRFIQEFMVPNGLYYLDQTSFEAMLERLGPGAMREQFRRNEELIAAPGPAAGQLARTLLQDPLRLREFLLAQVNLFAWSDGTANERFLYEDDSPTLSVNGRSLLIRVGGTEPASDLNFTKKFVQRIQAAADRCNDDGLQLEYAGAYAIAATSERAIRKDMTSSVLSSVLLIQGLFLVMYRRLASFALAFTPVAVAIVTAFGIFSVLSMRLTPATAVVGAILTGLGDDFSMHFLSHYDHRRECGDSPRDAAVASANELLRPMLAALLTSLVGFIAIMQSSVPALHDFAWLSGLGLALSMMASLTVLPALLVALEPKAGRSWMKPGMRLQLKGVVSFVDRRRHVFIVMIVAIWGTAFVTLLSHGQPIVPFATDLRVMHPQPNTALNLQEQLPALFGSAESMMFLHIRSQSSQGLLRDCHAVNSAMRDSAVRAVGVKGVYSLATLLPNPETVDSRTEQVREIDVPTVLASFDSAVAESLFDAEALQPSRELLAQFLRPVRAPDIDDLQRVPELAAFVLPSEAVKLNQPPLESLAIVFFDKARHDTHARDQVIQTIRASLRDLPDVTLTGLEVIGHDTQRSIRREMYLLSGVAIVAVISLIVLFYRHPRDVLLVLMPLMFGITCVLAYIHVANDGLNPISLIGIPLLIGAGEDYGLYVLNIAREARVARESIETLRARVAASLHALTGTWLTTMLGFGSLMFTSTPAIASLGRMIVIGMAACYVGTVFGLVPLLLVLHRRSQKRSH